MEAICFYFEQGRDLIVFVMSLFVVGGIIGCIIGCIVDNRANIWKSFVELFQAALVIFLSLVAIVVGVAVIGLVIVAGVAAIGLIYTAIVDSPILTTFLCLLCASLPFVHRNNPIILQKDISFHE